MWVHAYICVLLCFENKSEERTAGMKASNPLKDLQHFDLKKLVFPWNGGCMQLFFLTKLGFPVIVIGILPKCKFMCQSSYTNEEQDSGGGSNLSSPVEDVKADIKTGYRV